MNEQATTQGQQNEIKGTEQPETFFSKISHSFLEIDHQINQAKEKIDSLDNDKDKEQYTAEIKMLREERESIRQMLDKYRTSNSTESESAITTAWEKLKLSTSTFIQKFSK